LQKVSEAGLTAEVEQAAKAFVEDLTPNERIFQGFTPAGKRRYIPHTLENVVKILKKDLRGGENFNYGVGSLRAKFTPQFKSITQIRKAKDRLVSQADFEKIKKEIDDEFWNVARAINPDLSGDTAVAILEDAARTGVKRAAKTYGYDIDDDTAVQAAEFLTRLRELPTEYFEAKVLREVDLAEFSAAVVPDDVNPKVIAALQARGVKDIRTYKKGDEADRARQISGFDNLLFQTQTADPRIAKYRNTLLAGRQLSELSPEEREQYDALGADENASGMAAQKAIAEAAGFDTRTLWLHGTAAKTNFKAFKAGKKGVDELGPGIYFTKSQTYADAWNGNGRVEGGRTIPAYLRKGDFFDLSKPLDYLALAQRIKANNTVTETDQQAKTIRDTKSVTEWTPEESKIVNDASVEMWRGWLLESDQAFADNIKKSATQPGGRAPAALNAWLDRAGYIGAVNPNSQVPDQVVVFRPENIRSPWGRFDPARANSADMLAQENTTRGTFSVDTLTISLLEKADLSTFFHELGHFYLEVLTDISLRPDAPAEVVSDMNTLLAWFGIKVDSEPQASGSGALKQSADTPAKALVYEFRNNTEVQALQSRGLKFDFSSRKNTVTLDNIGVSEESRGAGIGSRALDILLDLADKHNVTVDLEVGEDEAGIDLVAWYTRKGFVWQDGFMERTPKPKDPSILAQDGNQPTDNTQPAGRTPLLAPNGKPSKLSPELHAVVRTPEFKKWFGDWEKHAAAENPVGSLWSDDTVSKVVDENGEPLVVYHGTDKGGFQAFKQPGGQSRSDLGIFTSSNKELAGSYVKRASRTSKLLPREEVLAEEAMRSEGFAANKLSGIYAGFLNIRNPNEQDFEGANWDGSRYHQWVVEVGDELQSDATGKQYFDSQEEALALAKEFADPADPEEGADYVTGAEDSFDTTDSVVRESQQYGNDGAIIRQVKDDGGGYSGYDGAPSDVFVAHKPEQFKSVENFGAFDSSVPSMYYQDGNQPTDNTQPAGRTPLEVWSAMSLDQKRKYHEKFAESFEQYLFEGKAPSRELQGVFSRVASWMKSVYQSIQSFLARHNTQLTDEVRAVFDRILATDEQIKEMQELRGMMPAFASAKDAGLSPEEWRACETLSGLPTR
jgi:ribosomal protein S18 acetylase RimI-like enzyme